MKKLNFSFLFLMAFTSLLLAQPMADFSASPTIGCAPLAVDFTDLSTGNNLTYVWDFGDGTTSTNINPSHVYIQEVNYTVCLTVTDSGSGQSDTACKTDYINIPPATSIIDPILCPDDAIVINGTTYNVNNPSGMETFLAGSYYGCDSTIVVDLNFFPSIVTSQEAMLCEGETIIIGGMLFDQDNPSGVVVLESAAANGCDSTINVDLTFLPTDFTNLSFLTCEGESVVFNGVTYNEMNPNGTVAFVNSLGCDSIIFVTVDFSPNPTIASATITDVSCAGSNDAVIEVVAMGGSPGYQYSWSNGSNSATLTGLAAGVYDVTVTDNFGCTAIEAFVITEPDPITVSITPPTMLSCITSSVFIDALASGGIPPYTYQWSNGMNSANITVDMPGTYSVTVLDGNACASVSTVEVAVDDAIPSGAIVAPAIVCPGEQITVCFEPDISAPDLTYQWIGPNGFTTVTECFTIDLLNSSTGCYSLTVTNPINGCTIIDQVCFPAFQDYTINASMNTICFSDSTQLFVQPFPAGSTVTWDTGLESLSCDDCPNPFASPTLNTEYNATMIDPDGCLHFLSFSMMVDSSCVWPGDTDTNKVVNHYDLLAIGLSYDSLGPIRPNANIGWFGQPGPAWLQNTPGTSVDLQHVDTDGNGQINADDTLAISMNWGAVHLFREVVDHQFTNNGVNAQSVAMAPFYVSVDTFMEGEMLALPIILGDVGVPLESLYGLAYTIEYDSTIVEASTASVDFNNSWVGELNNNMITIQRDFYSPGKVDVAMTRIDGLPMDGFGEIARMHITIQDDILFRVGGDTRSPSEGLEVEFNISNVLLITHEGEIIPVEPTATTSLVTDIGTGLSPEVLERFIQIFPNPAKDLIFIQSEDIKLRKVNLYNLLGQQVRQLKLDGQQKVEMSTNGLNQGTYLLETISDEGRLSKRIILME